VGWYGEDQVLGLESAREAIAILVGSPLIDCSRHCKIDASDILIGVWSSAFRVASGEHMQPDIKWTGVGQGVVTSKWARGAAHEANGEHQFRYGVYVPFQSPPLTLYRSVLLKKALPDEILC
jgi:hypothetical protein